MAGFHPGGSREDSESEEKDGSRPPSRNAGKGKPHFPSRRVRERGDLFAAALEIAVLFITALTLAIFLQAFFIKPFIIPSPSMEPTLQEGDRVLVDRLTYHFRKPHRGEVIVFRFNPNDPANATQGGSPLSRSLDLLAEVLNITHQEAMPFIKRVVGVEGDVVELREGQLYVNGEPYQADYQYVSDGSDGRWEVPAGTVMVMGDNRPNSNDSRRWGFVPYGAIMGRAVAVWWPPSHWTSL